MGEKIRINHECKQGRQSEQGSSQSTGARSHGHRRIKIDIEATKSVAAMVLAVEREDGVQYVYAVDGSCDEAEAREKGEVGMKAAAWGTWDGKVARGGALPPGTSNDVAELVAIERTLARHVAGDRVMVLSDCKPGLEAIEAGWRCGILRRRLPS